MSLPRRREAQIPLCQRGTRAEDAPLLDECLQDLRNQGSVHDSQRTPGRDALRDEDAAKGRERDGAQRACLQSDARHEYRRYKGIAGSDQGVSVETPLRADLEPDLAQYSPQ